MRITKRLLSPLLVLNLMFAVFFSCRRTDIVPEQDVKMQPNGERFFNIPTDASPQVKAIAQAIQKQANKYHFIPEITKKAGYPVWNKARIVSSANQKFTAKSDSATESEVVYIPFVLDSQRHTNAVLSVTLNPTDSIYRMLYASSYRLFGYDTTDNTKWSARTVFQVFSLFDYNVFGHKKFFIRDSLLFGRHGDTTKYVATLVNVNGQDIASRTTEYWDCVWLDMCPYTGGGGGGSQSARTTDQCENGFRLTYCNQTGGGSPGGPTSGSPSGAWIGTSNGTGPVYNPTGDPNNGGGGWWYGTGGSSGSPCSGGGGVSQRGNEFTPSDCGPGWTVVGVAPAELLTVDYSTDVANDPCLAAVISLIGGPGHNAFILKNYSDVPADNTTTIKYKVRYERNTNLQDQNGNPVAGHTDVNVLPGGINEVVVTVNPSYLSLASREYVTAVVLHELLHGILTVRAGSSLPTQKDQHLYMFNNKFLGSIYQALAEIFPTINQNSPSDLVALSLLGIDDAITIPDPLDPTKVIIDPAKQEFARVNYGQNFNSAITTGAKYRTYTQGYGTPFC